MMIKEETLKNVFLYKMMPIAAAIVAADTIPYMINNPKSALVFIPTYILIADTYNKCLKRFGGITNEQQS